MHIFLCRFAQNLRTNGITAATLRTQLIWTAENAEQLNVAENKQDAFGTLIKQIETEFAAANGLHNKILIFVQIKRYLKEKINEGYIKTLLSINLI